MDLDPQAWSYRTMYSLPIRQQYYTAQMQDDTAYGKFEFNVRTSNYYADREKGIPFANTE